MPVQMTVPDGLAHALGKTQRKVDGVTRVIVPRWRLSGNLTCFRFELGKTFHPTNYLLAKNAKASDRNYCGFDDRYGMKKNGKKMRECDFADMT